MGKMGGDAVGAVQAAPVAARGATRPTFYSTRGLALNNSVRRVLLLPRFVGVVAQPAVGAVHAWGGGVRAS